MAGKGLDLGKQFFQGILSKITDPEQRKAAELLMTNEAVLTDIGSGVAGQSEIDRQLQAATTRQAELDALAATITDETSRLTVWRGQLDAWYTANKDAIDKGKSGAKPGTEGTPTVTPQGLTDAQLNDRFVTERQAFLGYDRDRGQILRQHFTKFNEIVDLEPLLLHPKVGEIGLLGVYGLVHKDRLEAFETDRVKKAEDAIRLDERQKVQATMASMPYPSVTGAGSGSPLDALAVGKGDSVAEAAAAHYNRLQSERGAPA